MQQNQTKRYIIFTVAILMLSLGLWVAGCTPDEEVVEVTVRPTAEVGGTAVTSTVLPIPTATSIILSNLTPPLPGMLYWGPDGKETWLVDDNGQSQKLSDLQITPRLLADSRQFIYFRDDELWEMAHDGGDQHRLFSFADISPWYYWSAETGVTWYLDTAGAEIEAREVGKLKMLDGAGDVLNLTESYSAHAPVMAPDEKSIAFDEEGNPAIYQLETGKWSFDLTEYGLSEGFDFYSAAWSPDGRLLAWTAYNPWSYTYSLVIFNVETQTAEVIQFPDHMSWYIYTPLWHPDSNKLAVMRSGGDPMSDSDGWIIDLETQDRIFMGVLAEVQWSPYGGWLAYTLRVEEGQPFTTRVWVMKEDGREQHYLGYGENLVWSPDGRYLTYCGLEETGYEGLGRWLTSPETDWVSTPIDFGYQEGCNFVQWLELDQPELVAYVLPKALPSPGPLLPTPTIVPASTEPIPTVTAVCNLYPPGTTWPEVPLPSQCYDVLPDLPERRYCSCSNFEFSPDGKWFAFTLGDYLSGYYVQPGLINLETGEVQTNTVGTGLMQFLPNDERLVGNYYGEGPGEIWWANSLTGESLRLGPGGNVTWNADETAFVVEATPYVGMAGAVWGYNVETHTLFLPERWFADNKPVWVPEGTHLLYQHQTNIATAENMVTLSPRQIHMVDAMSGEEQVVLSDPAYHYHLCPDDRTESCYWNGDWIKIQRLPYHPATFDFEDYNNPDYRCAWYVKNCADQPEYLGLNWRTLEVLPWSEIVN